MRTSLDLCVCLLTLCGVTLGLNGPGVKVVVKEESDAVLPCSLSTKEDITAKIFDWRKDESRKDVFFYVADIHYNNGLTGQDEQFKGRVSHFQDQLMNGNASIKIQNTKMADSGIYSCIFPYLQPSQTFNIELVVEPILKDRSGEISGASPEPYIKINNAANGLLLQCEVREAFLKPKVEWQDSAGNILPAEELQVSERRGRYYVTLNTTVNKTGHYRCVVTQEDINHQISAKTYVKLNEDLSREVELWRSATIFLAVLVVVLLLVVTSMGHICYRLRKNPRPGDTDSAMSGDTDSAMSDSQRRKKPPPGDTDSAVSGLLWRRCSRDDPDDPEIVVSSKSPLSNGGDTDSAMSGPCLLETDYKPPAETESQSSA